jgi:hypothetical protein
MSVNQTFREIAGVQLHNTELTVNHAFTSRHTQESERSVEKAVSYVLKYENPFTVNQSTEPKLHNLLTRAIMPDEVRKAMSSVKETGAKLVETLRKERFIEKTKRLSDVIPRTNLKTCATVGAKKKVASKTKQKQDKRDIGSGQKKFDIARVRGHDPREIFKYDLVKSSYLFSDEDGLMKKPVKYELMKELEKKLQPSDYIHPSEWADMPTGYVIDVMAYVRKIPFSSITTFGELFDKFLSIVLGICKCAKRIDFVFDAYIQGSVKDSERQRRAVKTPILVSDIFEETKLPRDMDTFWPSSENKLELEELLKRCLIKHFSQSSLDIHIVLSGMAQSGESASLQAQSIKTGSIDSHPELDSDLEEADVRIIPHALHAARNGLQRLVVLSGDTDVFVLCLHFSNTLLSNGATEVWLRGGVGDKTRYIPIHVLADQMGQPLCETLPAVHALTGCDVTSKVGTKAAGLKADPALLKNFGQDIDDLLSCVADAERYLVQVIHRGDHGIETMDELRHKLYHQREGMTIQDLPPTTNAIHSHILRAFYSNRCGQ